MRLTRDNIDNVWKKVWEKVRQNHPGNTKGVDALLSQLAPLYENEDEITLVAATHSIEKLAKRLYFTDIIDAFIDIFQKYIEVYITYLPALEAIPIKTGLEIAFEELSERTDRKNQEKIVGIPTGFHELDQALGGLRKGQLTVLSGWSYTSEELALNIAVKVAKAGACVYYFSTVNSASITIPKIVCIDAGIHLDAELSGHMYEDDWQNAADAVKRLSSLDFFIIDSPSFSYKELETTVALTRGSHADVLLIIDNIESMTIGRGFDYTDREKQINEIVQKLRKVAVSMNVSVCALSRVARYLDTSYRPRIEDLAYAVPIRQFADVIMLLDSSVSKEEAGINGKPALDEAKLYIDKNRNGQTGELVRLSFNRYTGAFSDYRRASKDRRNRHDEDDWENISYEDLKTLLSDEEDQ